MKIKDKWSTLKKAKQIASTIDPKDIVQQANDIAMVIGGIKALLNVLEERDLYLQKYHGNTINDGVQVVDIPAELDMIDDWRAKTEEIDARLMGYGKKTIGEQ